MMHFSLQTFSPVRLGALLAALAIAAAPAVALAESPAIPAPAVAPAEEAVLGVRVLRIPASLGSEGIRQLSTELKIAGQSSALILVGAHGSPELDRSVGDDDLAELAGASATSTLFIRGDAPGLLSAFAAAGVRFEQVDSAGELRESLGVDRLEGLDGGSLSGESLSSLLGPSEEAAGGLSPLVVAAAALGLGALAFGARHLRVALRRDGRRYVTREPVHGPAPEPVRTRRRRSPVPVDDARLPASGRARVRSELHPEGYVELASCLRRARWADARVEPPGPGQWVEVDRRHGALIAFPSPSSRRVAQ
jgi:hypothetical protein